jgi:hypothetical protein
MSVTSWLEFSLIGKRKTKSEMKILKIEVMKTRIFTTAALFIFTTSLVAGTVNKNEKDSTTLLAYATIEKSKSESDASNGTFSFSSIVNGNVNLLENWIADRESWEQEGSQTEAGMSLMETVNLEEWISERESWEQDSETTETANPGFVNLEEWITDRETWEQEGTDSTVTSASDGSDLLVDWVIERENWEQK